MASIWREEPGSPPVKIYRHDSDRMTNSRFAFILATAESNGCKIALTGQDAVVTAPDGSRALLTLELIPVPSKVGPGESKRVAA